MASIELNYSEANIANLIHENIKTKGFVPKGTVLFTVSRGDRPGDKDTMSASCSAVMKQTVPTTAEEAH